VCFGLDHPYLLQTLALWTFLKEKRDKTDEELLSLMNFHYNRPVDVSAILTARNLISPDVQRNVQSFMNEKADAASDGVQVHELDENGVVKQQ
jgi:hypothetical protein